MEPATSEEGESKIQNLSMEDRFKQIRCSINQRSQQHASVILNAVEDTLREQNSQFSSAAYFAALLSLSRRQKPDSPSSTAVLYLLDLITPTVSVPLLRQNFAPILDDLGALLSVGIGPAATRSIIGVLESLLKVQDSQAWALPQSQVGPRKGLGNIITLALDARPKVRKRAHEAASSVLQNAPPGPLLDHPAADMCAETSLLTFKNMVDAYAQTQVSQKLQNQQNQQEPQMIHAMQLLKTIAQASRGWPTRSLDSLLDVLLPIARSKSTYLTMTAFDVFEVVIQGMAASSTTSKLSRLLDAILDAQPSQNDSQLLPPWIAVISRGYEISAQLQPLETFADLPNVFEKVSLFLSSTSYNIRVSASECLISFLVHCIPDQVILEPSIYDEKIFEKLSTSAEKLLQIKYQAAWMEIFMVIESLLTCLRWRSFPLMKTIIAGIGELRTDEGFQEKERADRILAKAIRAMGPENFLTILPLNIGEPSEKKQGRAWLIPLLRDNVENAKLAHFRQELVPLSETLHARASSQASAQRTLEQKIFETLVQQIWDCLPGYCTLPLDLKTAFDQEFAELISTLLYQQPEMRLTLCQALQNLVTSSQAVQNADPDSDLARFGRISKTEANEALDYIAAFSANLLAVLFNVYSETASHQRGPLLSCIDCYLSVSKPDDVRETFNRVCKVLESCLEDTTSDSQKKHKQSQDGSHATKSSVSSDLMDIVVTIAIYIPRESFQAMFNIASIIISKRKEPQLQKKAYKIISRLGQSETGRAALNERGSELRQLLLENSENVLVSARRDRYNAISELVHILSPESLSFIPHILPEVILGTKESNERARGSAFQLIVQMGQKMRDGGKANDNGSDPMSDSTTSVSASIDEYITMLSAGLAGTTPHMISASVTALSRTLFEFGASLQERTVVDLIQTMDLFLTSPTREVVRSVLGFVKVSVLSVSAELMKPRLPSILKHLLSWSQEHKSHFKAKVKNILERMIRHYGFDTVSANCPEQGMKLLNNIRKTRERHRRKKLTHPATDDATAATREQHGKTLSPKSRYESEFDEAIYGSDSSSNASAVSDDERLNIRGSQNSRKKNDRSREKFIHEEPLEPLDLLSKKVLSNISSTRPPVKKVTSQKRHKTNVDADGKLIFNMEDSEGDALMIDRDDDTKQGAPSATSAANQEEDLMTGINAYVDAIRGRDAAQRGQRGRLKFKNPVRDNKENDEEREDRGRSSMPASLVQADGLSPGPKVKSNQHQRSFRGSGAIRGGRVMKQRNGRKNK